MTERQIQIQQIREIPCPSGFTFLPRKFTGRTMAQLAARDVTDSIADVIAAHCVKVTDPGPYALGDKDGLPNWKMFLDGDASVAFARLSTMSMAPPQGFDPEERDFDVLCPDLDCRDPQTGKRTRYEWTVRLCDVPVISLSEETRDLVRRGNRFEDKLPDGRKFTYKLPTPEDLPVMRKLFADNGIVPTKIPPESAGTVIMPFLVAARVLSVEGCSNTDMAREEILDLDPMMVQDAAGIIMRLDCGFDEFKSKCERCGTEATLRLPPSPRLLVRPKRWALASGRSSAGTSPG